MIRPTRPTWNATFPLTIGILALIFLVGGIGYWSISTKISGAVVSTGMIEVENNRQVVQHPEGGVVGEILAKNGNIVEAGDVLIRFDDTLQRSKLAIVESQLFEIYARADRLKAEREGEDKVTFSLELQELAANRPFVVEQLDGQIRLFEARLETLAKETEQLTEQIDQIGNQIEGTEAQLTSLAVQRDLNAKELTDQEKLLRSGLVQASRVTDLQREEAQLLGEISRLNSQIAQLRGQIAGLEIEKLKLGSTRREEAIITLRDLENREIELSEQQLSLKETLSRLEVRAPVAGAIYGSTVFALRSVVQPAAQMMFIIPLDQPLVVVARINSNDVDQAYVGQEASLRFTAFDQRQTPEIFGKVSEVSADVFQDEITGLNYYRVVLLPDDAELAKLEDQVLLPGMPVEAYLKTSERTPLSYLTKPLTDYFNRAFRG